MRISRGKRFHKAGAQTEKALWPYILLNLPLGGTKRNVFNDRRSLAGTYNSIKSFRYNGAIPCTILYVSNLINNLVFYCDQD